MFGPIKIDDSLAIAVLESVDANHKLVRQRFMYLVKAELASGSSMLEHIFVQEEKRYEIHRIVRMFIHTDSGICSDLWNIPVYTAVMAIHRTVRLTLQEENDGFYNLLDILQGRHLIYLEHADFVVRNLGSLSSHRHSENFISMIMDPHEYIGHANKLLVKETRNVEIFGRLEYLL